MVGDVAGGAVAAHERIGGVLAGVDDVAEQLALRVLRAGLAEVLAEAPVDERRALVAPALDRQAAHQQEAAAVAQLAAPARRSAAPSVGSGKSSRCTSPSARPRRRTPATAAPSSSTGGVEPTIQSSRRATSAPRHAAAPSSGARRTASCGRWK